MEDKSIHIYTMINDSNFAPHVSNNLLSLACCAGPVREYTFPGNYVLGISGSTMKHVETHVPIYLMRVGKRITFNAYFQNPKYWGRIDNMYKKANNGKYIQDRRYIEKTPYTDFHVFKKCQGVKDDAQKSEYVLLSEEYYYFGNAYIVEKKLCEKTKKFLKNIRFTYTVGGHYKKLSLKENIVKQYINFIERTYAIRDIGEPNQ